MEDVSRASNTFDSIAEHFDRTRKHPWKEVTEFILGCRGTILDIGCGNGRHTLVAEKQGLDVIGLDASLELLKIAREKCEGGKFVRANVKKLPFAPDTFDHVLYIATIHHLSKGRVESLRQAKNVLKKNGTILVSGWAREADRWDIPKEERDLLVPWTREDGKVFNRYYHLYTLEELKDDVEKSGLKVVECFRSGDNNYVMAVKH